MEYLGCKLGGRFLVMSATFPSALRALERVLENVALEAAPGLFQQFARHRLRLLATTLDDAEVIDRITDRATLGESILVVSNTVSGAASVCARLAGRLEGSDVAPELIHGRFNGRDRFRKEHAIQARMGTRTRDRDAAPVVLVATRVVEVSLNIDFDTIFTEPAPLEAFSPILWPGEPRPTTTVL